MQVAYICHFAGKNQLTLGKQEHLKFHINIWIYIEFEFVFIFEFELSLGHIRPCL